MKRIIIFLVSIFLCTFAYAAQKEVPVPKELSVQIQNLTELLRDSYAVGYPEATIHKTIKLSDDNEITLAVFTIEGFGGGNNHTQYLAGFTPEKDETNKIHYQLIDVIPIGGKGSRGVFELNVNAKLDKKTRITTFVFDTMTVTKDDAPNFPSKNTKTTVILNDNRFTEVK